jgi:hypothetical protein
VIPAIARNNENAVSLLYISSQRRAIAVFMTFATPALCSSGGTFNQNQATTKSSILESQFKDCDFQFIDTNQVTHSNKPNNGLSLHQEGACSYYLNIKGFRTLGDQSVTLMIVNQHGDFLNQSIAQSGFERKSDGTWGFIGNSFSAGKLLKYQKLSLEKTNNNDDVTLVGRQIEHGTDQTGTPMTFEGIHVLRLSPTYAVSVDMPFDIGTPPNIRDEVTKDIVKLVNSVHSTVSTTPATNQ